MVDAVMAESGMFPFSNPSPAMHAGGLGVENPGSKKKKGLRLKIAAFFVFSKFSKRN